MRYEDASGSIGSQGSGVTDARDDADALPAGSHGPATGNTITGEGTITGAAGADIVDHGPGKIVALEGAGGGDTADGGSLHVEGRFGEITMDSRGGYSYTPHGAKPQGGSDVFRYTLADADGTRDTATLTIDIGREIEKIDANAQVLVPGPDGVITLPPGVELSDIMVVGRNLVINLPDGTQMVIIDGAVFVPQLVLNGVEVPATNLASLLIDLEPQPAAGTPTSSGGNFAVDVPPLDPGVPLGDLIPPTELVFEPPIFRDIGQFEDDEPEIFIQPDGQPASVAAADAVDERGLPSPRLSGANEPPGSGEGADGSGTNNSDTRETTTGVIIIDAEDTPTTISITVNGTTTVVTGVGQVIVGQYGNLTITSISDTQIGYSYTLRDNTSGDATHDDFSVTLTDNDGDTATATLRIDIIDDVPTARPDTDAIGVGQYGPVTGNIITDASAGDAGDSDAGADTVGADNASITSVSSANVPANSDSNPSGGFVVNGQYGVVTIQTDGSYSYVRNPGTPGGVNDVFNYTLTDGDGDTSTTTLTITIADATPSTGQNPTVLLDDDALAGGNPGGVGDDVDAANTSGTLAGSGGDSPIAFSVQTTGAPAGFTYVSGGAGILLVQQGGTTVLTITVNPATGAYSVVQNAPIDHAAGDNENNAIFPINYTVTDVDGDTATGTLTINVDDDTPIITRQDISAPTLTVDETDLSTNASGNFSTLFAVSYGADGPGATTYSVTVVNGTDSGLDDVATGQDILLFNNGGVVEGRVGGAGGPVAFTVSVNSATGVVTLDQIRALEHPDATNPDDPISPAANSIQLTVNAVDGDGDPVSQTINIGANLVFEDDGPTVTAALLTGTVDEDGVPGGIPGGVGDVAGENTVATGSVASLFNSGADQPLTFSLVANTSGLPALTSAGVPVTYSVVGNTLTASAGANTVFTFVLNADGSYTFTLVDQLDHPAGNNENDLTIQLGSMIRATDADGDSVVAPANGLTITVDDDTPTASGALLTGTVDEDGVPGGIAGGVGDVAGENTVASGSVATLFNSGADQPLTYSLLANTSGLPALTSAGAPVTYSVVGNTLTASASGHTVFTFVLNANGTYTFTLVDQLDHAPGGNENDLAISLGSIIQATDADGDSVTANANGLVITVDDDTPQNNAVTAALLVDEDALPGGNPGGPNDGPGVFAAGIANIGALFSSGADQPLTISMSSDTSGLPALTSAGVPVTYSVVGNTLTASAGGNTVFTLVFDPGTGQATFTLLDQLDHPTQNGTPDDNTENNLILDLSSVFVGTDADGDSVRLDAGSFTVDVDDDTPTIVAQVALTGTVDEDGLAGGNPGGVNDVAGENVDVAGNVSPLFSPGADQPLTYSLLTNTSGLPALTSNGVPVTYSVVGNTLTASAGGNTVFTFTLNATTGAYTFTLLDQLDHPSLDDLPGDNTENPPGSDIAIQLGSIIQATDADGDSVTAPANGLTITVDDDSPQEFVECPTGTSINTPGSTFTGDLNLPPVGADQPGTVSFVVEDGDPVLDAEGQPVTSNGEALFYFVNSEGVLEARVGDATGDVIFTVTLNGDGTFTYDQIGQLGEGGGTTFNDLTSTSGGNAEFRGIGANDPATTVDILLSAEAAGADATVNTDSDSIGAANQSMDVGETVRIDFVTDLTSPAATPSGFTYSGHVSSNSFIEVIPQVQGPQTATVAFTVWALDTTNTAASEPDRNPTGGFSDSTITEITEVTVTDYLTGNSTTVDVTGFTTGVFTAVAYGISVRVNADGSVTFAGVQEGDSYGINTGTNEFNAIAVQSDPTGTGGSTENSFDLGVFSIGTETVVEPIELSIPIALTDSDGDSVACDIDFVVGPPVDAPDITVTVNEAGLPVIGSNAASNLETQSGDLQTLVTGGTGPYTFTLIDSGDGAFGTLTLNSNGTFSYTLDTPVDSQPDANDGTNPELAVESFTFEAEDVDGNIQTGTITVNVIDDVPSIDVTAGPETGVLVQTQDADTIGVATDTASSSANFGGVFARTFEAGADGAAATPVLTYTLGVSAPGVNSGLDQGGADIFLYVIGGKVVGSTSATSGGVLPANTVFDVSVNSSGVVTLTQYSQIDHPLQAGLNDAPFADQLISMADNLVTLTASSTITDNDGDVASDSAMINIGANLQFADHGPVATNDVDAIAAGYFGTATGNVMTGVDIAVGADSNSSDGSADNVGADTPGRISQVSFTSDGGGAPVVQAISAGGSTVINGDYGVLTLYSNGDYSYDRNEGSAGGVNDVFTYTLRDFDGDTSTATLTINIAVNPPVATTASAAVDDDGLTGANAAGANDINANTFPNPDDLDGAASSEASFRGQLGVTGGDGDIDFSLIAPGTGITVGQETVSITGTASLLTATITASPDSDRLNDTLFTVSLNQETGEYIVTLVDNVLHGADANEDEDGTEVSVTINYQVIDASLNSSASPGALTIVFNDDVPTAAIVTTGQTVSLDESAGNQGDSNDVDGPIAAFAGVSNVGDDPDVAGTGPIQYAANASALVASTGTTLGADGGTVAFSLNVSSAGVDSGLNTTAGADIFLYKEGDVIVGRVGSQAGPAAFAIAINSVTGAVSMVEYLSIQHTNAANPDDSVSIANGAILAVATAADADGDVSTASTAIGGLISFQDSAPIMTAASNINIQNSGDVAHTGTFAFNLGADGAPTSNDVISAVTGSATVNGTAVTNYVLTPGAETATTASYSFSFDYASGPGTTAHETGTLVFDKAAGTYTVDLDQPIQPFTTILQTAAGTLFQGYEFGTSTPDSSQPAISVTQIQGTPGTPLPSDLFVQFTGVSEPSSGTGDDNLEVTNWVPGANNPLPVSGGGDVAWNAGQVFNQVDGWVSTSGSANGTDGDTIQGGEVLDFTLVKGANPTGILAAPATYGQASSMFLKFDGIGASEDMIVILKLYDPTTNAYTTRAIMIENTDIQHGPGTGPGLFSGITLDNNDGLVIIESNDYNNPGENWVIVGAQIAGSDEGITGTAINLNGAVGAAGDSDVDNNGSLDTDPLGFQSDTDDGPFKISSIGFLSTTTTAQPADLTFNVTVQDGDGDTVSQTIHATVSASADSSTPIVLAPAVTTVSQEPLVDKSASLLQNTDSIDNHRTMSAANNNSVLLGAIAAAGLGVSSAAAAQGFAQASDHLVLDTSSLPQDAASVSGFAIDHREMARDGLGGETQEVLRGNDNAGESTVQRAIVDKLSLTDASHDQGQAPTELLQGTEQAGSNASQSNLTSASVAMPSAETLAGGNSNDNAAQGQTHGATQVGQALLDALAGGGHGPDIDAVIDAVANQGHGRDAAALEALASHAAGDVSAWHMAGFGGFPGGHGAAMEPMLHHDAVIVVS